MKHVIRLTFVVPFTLLFYTGFAQSPTLQQKLYYTCKVWGFVKYYHSEVSTCHVNWDSILLHTLPLVRNATTNNEFNDALDTMLAAAGPMTISTTYFPDTLPIALKRNRNWNWIGSPIFRSDVKIQLDTIKNNFRPHTNCQAIVNPSASYSFADPWGGYLKFPMDTTLLNLNTSVSYPDADHRQLMLFKLWNIIRYFNPYNYTLDKSWDTTLYNYATQIDTASGSYSLFLLNLQIAATLDDAHVYGLTWSYQYQTPPGFYTPLIRLKYMSGQYVVTKSNVTNIHIGDAIVSVDGHTPSQWEDSLKPFYSAGNTAVFRRIMSENILNRMSYGAAELIVVEDSMGAINSINTTCINPAGYSTFFNYQSYYTDSLSSLQWTTMPCDIAYVNMANVAYADAPSIYPEIKNKSAIIFDLRNDSYSAGPFASLMLPGNVSFAKLMEPDTTFPGSYYYENQEIGVPGNPDPYTGLVILLINENAQSHVEYSAMVFEAMSNVIKVGSQTAGADGNITWLSLSQDMRLGWTSLGVFYPNGDSTQRIGIVPDTIVYPTRESIRHNRDIVLEKALAIAGCDLYTNNIFKPKLVIDIYPNPANETVTIKGDCGQRINVSITDVTGRILMQKNITPNNVDHFSATFNTTSLPTGLYFIHAQTSDKQFSAKFVKN